MLNIKYINIYIYILNIIYQSQSLQPREGKNCRVSIKYQKGLAPVSFSVMQGRDTFPLARYHPGGLPGGSSLLLCTHIIESRGFLYIAESLAHTKTVTWLFGPFQQHLITWGFCHSLLPDRAFKVSCSSSLEHYLIVVDTVKFFFRDEMCPELTPRKQIPSCG